MSSDPSILEEILGDLSLLRDHESELIAALTALIDSPDRPAVPSHIRGVFKLAKAAFDDSAARFLIQPHWKFNNQAPIVVAQTAEGAQEVEDLLGHIIHGICVLETAASYSVKHEHESPEA